MILSERGHLGRIAASTLWCGLEARAPAHIVEGAAAMTLHFAHDNFVRLQKNLRIAPAMAAGVSDRVWTLEELVKQTSK